MKPLLLHTEEVRHLLRGEATCIVRPLKTQPLDVLDMAGVMYGKGWIGLMYRDPDGDASKNRGTTFGCSYGTVGDQLWVREDWDNMHGRMMYRADEPDDMERPGYCASKKCRWMTAVTMARWRSRMDVEILSIRCWRAFLSATTKEDWRSRMFPYRTNPWCWNITVRMSGDLHPTVGNDWNRGEIGVYYV